jgi:amino acid adenylation domain-containing protein
VKVLDRSCVPIALTDLSSTPQGDRDRVASAACTTLLSTPLDLAGGLVARVQIGVFAPDDHLLALSMHHIVSDGWSIAIIFRDLRTAYDARLTGAAPDLTPPKVRYLDFAAWEQDRAATHKFDKSSAYWRRALAGVPPLLDLPCDRPRPPNGSVRGARARLFIDESLADRLEKTARAHGATLFMTLVAVWQALLSRLSGQDDVVIGTAVANRDNVALEDVVGFLVNNVPLRGDLSGAPSFAELLTRTKLAVFGAFEHADLPFEALVEAVNPGRTAAHTPIFQTLLTLHNYPSDSVGPGGLAVDPIELDVQAARFDLVLDLGRIRVGSEAGKMGAGYEYAADLFDEATILRWHDAFLRLLEVACASPERSLVEVPLLSKTEAEEFHGRLNDTTLDHDHARSTHAVLQEAAGRHAEAVAIVAHDGQLTYAEFESRTNQLANLLVERGVKQGSRVAVCLERGLDLPVALAAAWKAGAAYVPLDPAHPSPRLGYILEDAEVACVLSASTFASIFAGVSTPLVQLDVDADAIAAAPTTAPELQVAPDELAYVIYTSGSTGKPKGVEVEHRNLVAFLEAMKQVPGLGAGETLLAVTTPSFDIAGLELWLPLSVGGKVLIASRQDTLDGKRLAELLEEHAVSMLQATPATWRLMLESGWQGKTGLAALCGGDAMPLDLARSLTPRVGTLWNMYGPTETTIWSTIYRVKGDEGVVPIGRAIANTRVYVLDASGTPTPIGVPGELVITGEGVTRGYRNRPELNAEKFVYVAPLGTLERAFRTGDLARWRSDGQLEFLGRGDGQVKIRGFRIELGEIEARLAGLALVRSAVVAAREDTPGDKRLVAYVVMAPGATFDEAQTRAALRETLPDYMVPGAYMQLERLPMSANGKVDRKALPAPNASVGLPPDESDALMTSTQRNVADLWREVLRIDRVGLHQNFFDLGGHSLLLIKLQVGLKALFGQEISVVELFQHTTVAAQAERFTSTTRSAADALTRARAKTKKAGHG